MRRRFCINSRATMRMEVYMVNLTVSLAGVELKNPIIPASGTFGYGRE